MAYKVKIECPKHTRFNPERQGEADIRGGCVVCYELLRVHKLIENFNQGIYAPVTQQSSKL